MALKHNGSFNTSIGTVERGNLQLSQRVYSNAGHGWNQTWSIPANKNLGNALIPFLNAPLASGSMVGTSSGSSSASAIISALASVSGTSSGTSTALATIQGLAYAIGSSTGLSTAQAIGLMYGYITGVSNGLSSATGILTTLAPSGNLTGTSLGSSSASAIISALVSVSGSSVGSSSSSATLSALGYLVGTAQGASTASANGIAAGFMTGNSSPGSGGTITGSSITSDDIYNAKLGVAQKIAQVKVMLEAGSGYGTLSSSSGSIPGTTAELINLQTELDAELSKLLNVLLGQ